MVAEKSAPRSGDRLAFLDVVRGFAALVVVAQHLLERDKGYLDFSAHYFDLGLFGVTVFLIVSGYIIPVSIERSRGLKDFWLKRFLRLYPMYWVSLAAAGVAYACGIQVGPGFDPRSPANWLANVTMLQQFAGRPHAIAVYWTLTIEMALYATCSVLFAFGKLKKAVPIAWTMMGLVFVLGVLVPVVTHKRLPGGYFYFFMTPFIGHVFYRLGTGEVSVRAAKVIADGVIILAVMVAVVAFGLYPREGFAIRPLAMCLTWCAGYLFFAFMLTLRSKAMPRFLVWTGVVSYSVYLIHPLVLEIANRTVPELLRLPVVLGASLALSGLTYRFVEKPAIDLGRRISKSRAKPDPAAQDAL